VKTLSLERRIVLALLFSAPLLWLLSAGVALYQTYGEVDELYDGQLVLLTRQLLRSNQSVPHMPAMGQITAQHDDDGDDNGLAQAVWSRQGALLWSDGGGAGFAPALSAAGFHSLKVRNVKWRVYIMRSPDNARIVAVGQKQSMRGEVAWQMVSGQLMSWLVPLPLLLLALVLAVRRGLLPLKQLALRLARRRADDLTPILDRVPAEAEPLINALNTLFERVTATLERERRFTADAAHELRTPLAALRIQTEVAQLAQDPATLNHALANLGIGIERATHLIEQLLALSRLDPMEASSAQSVNWARVCECVCQEMAGLARQKQIAVTLVWGVEPDKALPLKGDETLLALMLRNLLENALRYTPPGGAVTLECAPGAISVLDNGPGVEAQWLDSIRQRFFRPPGQRETGSGLGLSIVERIAELHHLQLQLENRAQGGFCARLQLSAK
jgi:two-component system sensor histidine kinase QseC